MEIKTCPFCGSEAIDDFALPNTYWIQCTNQACLAMGPWGESKQDAIDRWNERKDNGEVSR